MEAPCPQADARHVHVAIAGSGFGGLGLAIRMLQAGMRRLPRLRARRRRRRRLARQHLSRLRLRRAVAPLLLLVRAQPRLEPRLLARRRDPRLPPRCAERFGVLPHIRFGHEIARRRLGRRAPASGSLETSRGRFTADVFVGAVGALSEPSTAPACPASTASPAGSSTPRAGTTATLSTARRVAVIGTGASAIQFVPQIQPRVGAAAPLPAHAAVDRAAQRLRLHARARSA